MRRAAFLRPLAALWRARLEFLPALLLLGAWGLTTWGVAGILAAAAPRFAWTVWPLSGGLLCACLFGLGFLRDLARVGLYELLSAKEPKRG